MKERPDKPLLVDGKPTGRSKTSDDVITHVPHDDTFIDWSNPPPAFRFHSDEQLFANRLKRPMFKPKPEDKGGYEDR